MSELQAILARRRRLNQEISEEETPATHTQQALNDGVTPTVSLPVASNDDDPEAQQSEEERPPTPPPSPPKQAKPTAQTPPRIANDLQAKLRERRMKAAADSYEPTPVNHGAQNANATSYAQINNVYNRQQSVPPRKSTFFPRSTPVLPKSSGNGTAAVSNRNAHEVPNSPGGSSVASQRKIFEVPDSPGSSVGETIRSIEKNVEGTARNAERATPSSPARKQIAGESKSPSMLDLMAERYKEQKLLRQQSLEKKQTTSKPEDEKLVDGKPQATYYRSGMRPPSSVKSYPTSPGSVAEVHSNTRVVSGKLHPSPRSDVANNQNTSSNGNNIPSPRLYADQYSNTKSSISSINSTGSISSDTENVPEFMRMKLKRTKEQNAQARSMRIEAGTDVELAAEAAEPTRWQSKLTEEDPPVMKRWQPPGDSLKEQQNGVTVQEEGALGVPSFDSVPQKESPSFDETPQDPIDQPLYQKNIMYANYDTAVLAAKEAIDASNRSRSRNNKTEEDVEVGDPELTLEPSPTSSLDGLEQSEDKQGTDDNETISRSNAVAASFVDSSIDMFASSDDEKENKDVALSSDDDFGFAPTPFFGLDPFDPFSDGEKHQIDRGLHDTKQTGHVGRISNFLSEAPEESDLLPSSSEDSHHFDAQFQDNFVDVIADQDVSEQHDEDDKPSKLVVIESNEVADESIPQSREVTDNKMISQRQSFDGQYERDNDEERPATTVEEHLTAVDDTFEVSDEAAGMENLVHENDEQDDEVLFDDSYGTFTVHPLDIKFAPPNDLHRLPSPTQNPLTGNPIICRFRGGDLFIEEVDTTLMQSPTILISARVVSNEFESKIPRTSGVSSMKVIGVASVLSLAAGVHRVHGRERVRVAALVEFVVSPGTEMKRVRAIAVWKWGYNLGKNLLVSLQSVLNTTSIDSDQFVYNPKTLQLADGLIFLGGNETEQMRNVPAVFLAKPAARDGWVSIRISDSDMSSVTALAPSNDHSTLLAVGLSDGSGRILDYNVAARTNRIAQNTDRNGHPTSLLRPVCILRGEIEVAELSDHDCLWKSANTSRFSSMRNDITHCTSLSWIKPCSSGFSALPLLAAAFRSGVVVYHIYHSQDAMSVRICPPLAKAKYSTSTSQIAQAKVSWFDLGPRSPPCLVIILEEGKETKLNLCAIDIPWYGSSDIGRDSIAHRPIGVLSQIELSQVVDSTILTMHQNRAIGCYCAGQLVIYRPSLSQVSRHVERSLPNMVDAYFDSIFRPVSSQSLGLNTDGTVYFNNCPTAVKSQYDDAVLSVFTTNVCSKIDYSGQDGLSFPSQRNWLLLSVPGDTHVGSLVRDELDDDNFNISYRRDAERGGAVSEVLCELTCGENPVSGLVPQRIVREDGGRRVAVMFIPGYFGGNFGDVSSRSRRKTHTRISTDPVAYALLDIDEAMKKRSSTTFTLRHARDVAFLPTSQMEGGFYCSSIVVLDSDGAGLSITTVISSRSKDAMTEKVIESEDRCLLHHEGIEGRRVFTLLNGDRPQLLLAGVSNVVMRPCLIVAQHRLEKDTYSNTFSLIESDSLGHRLWLAAGEEILSIRELPKHPNAVYSHIAVATQERVMILSADENSLSILTEINAHLTCASLSPIGSHCVAFVASPTPYCDGKSCIMYLSCLRYPHGHGVISAVASKTSKRGYQYPLLLQAIRPDRVVTSCLHGSIRLSNDDDESKFEIPVPTSHPILLLEPLIANALCQDQSSGNDASDNVLVQRALCLVIEKFGRKDTALPHGDDEGIGCNGAGITSSAYKMLARFKCHQAASLLLLGNGGQNINVGDAKLLPPWATISSKLLVLSDVNMQHDASRVLEALVSENETESSELMPRGLARSLTKISHLAPSSHTATSADIEPRGSLLHKEAIEAALIKQNNNDNIVFTIREDLSVFSTGPFDRKEKLLHLNTLEDWFGRCLPAVLGNEGVQIAAETGEQTLKDILAAAALEHTSQSITSVRNRGGAERRNWVEGIGDAHLDEDNLSLYLRFSEGADEDNNYARDGFSDLSKHEHTCHLYGSEFATVEATRSSADEGEEGKVHLLHDLVYSRGAPRDIATGVAVHVARGDSLDVGMLHSLQNKTRQRCTIEFWYHLPQSNLVTDEIILARRALLFDEDPSQLCLPDSKHNTLWELVLLPTGLLELRTSAGSVVSSAMAVEVDKDHPSNGIVSWENEDGRGGWNHVCVLFSAQEASSTTEFSASILMNGSLVVSCAIMHVNPLEAELPHFIDEDDLEDAMEKSILAFGIGPSVGFRMTEVRVWACLRDEEDIKLMMYEYLRDAEMKRKLKVNIRKELKHGLLASSLPTTSQADKKIIPISPPSQVIKETQDDFMPDFANFETVEESNVQEIDVQSQPDIAERSVQVDPPADPSFTVSLSDLLSSKVSKSASSLIVRGPPASRHFGGNRGGVICSNGRLGVGPIAICGTDKSIVFYHDLDPPAKTYPIGASGAILSDIVGDKGSEYMCCFLAKEKRMIVFELALKAVVVQLQMKTKLNFWRSLPLEADGGDLTFLLITPIGGFHWKPLDDSPRPRVVWNRGAELDSKKILAYEEGGSCGRDQSARSTIALVLASQGTSEAAVEAYCISLENEASRMCISPNVLGAALYRRPAQSASSYFLPFVISVTQDEGSRAKLNVHSLCVDRETSESIISLGDTISSIDMDMNHEKYDAPSLSMGTSPEVLCCCYNGFIVAIARRSGLVFAYDFTNESLARVGRIALGHYVIDVAIRSGSESHDVELVVLLAEANDSKDGRIASIIFSRD